MNVTIPANAVSSPVTIEVTELNNDLPNGIGKIYSLTNQEFLKPVTLTLAYSDADLNTKKTYSALLQLLTRKSATDAWEVVKDFTINTSTKALTAQVDHFSDWVLVSAEGTLDFTVDGVSYKNLSLAVTMNNNTGGKSAKFVASNSALSFIASIDSTLMGTSYETHSAHLDTIHTKQSATLWVEPHRKTCYTGDANRLRFTSYSTIPGDLVTGTFTLIGTTPTDNSACQTQKKITGTFSYLVKASSLSAGIRIGSLGGTLESSDKNFSATIPAGALGGDVSFEVKELTNELSNGIGKIYSLTDQQFLKPVTLTLHYVDQDLTAKKTYPELLKIATRKSNGPWQVIQDFTLDQIAKTLTISADHLSDWTIISTTGTLDFTVDGVAYKNLSLSVTMSSGTGNSAKFQANNDIRSFVAMVDSTTMGTNYATLSNYLEKIESLNPSTGTSDVILVTPATSSCYNRFNGSNKLRFTKYTTATDGLVTGTFTFAGVSPVDNNPCQVKKVITGSFAYKVK